MTRSRRKTPIDAITTAESDKFHKIRSHRAERRAVRQLLATDGEPPHPKSYGDPWDGGKDGKKCFEQKQWPERMRK